MIDPFDNPLHACDDADRLEQLTDIAGDIDEYPHRNVEGAHRNAHTSTASRADQAADPRLLDYAMSRHNTATLTPATIIDDLEITPDAFYTAVLSELDHDPPTPIDPATVRELAHHARHYLWIHRC